MNEPPGQPRSRSHASRWWTTGVTGGAILLILVGAVVQDPIDRTWDRIWARVFPDKRQTNESTDPSVDPSAGPSGGKGLAQSPGATDPGASPGADGIPEPGPGNPASPGSNPEPARPNPPPTTARQTTSRPGSSAPAWRKSGPWRFVLYDRTTESDRSLALQDAIRFNGTQQPTMSNKSINEYTVGVDAYWRQLNYWNWSGSASSAPSPESCRSTGRTGNETVKADAGLNRVFCRDETETHQPTTISYLRFVDVSHFDESPGYVTIEVWFQQATSP